MTQAKETHRDSDEESVGKSDTFRRARGNLGANGKPIKGLRLPPPEVPCKGFTQEGKPCQMPPKVGDEFCMWHHPDKGKRPDRHNLDPEIIRVRAARRKGGLARGVLRLMWQQLESLEGQEWDKDTRAEVRSIAALGLKAVAAISKPKPQDVGSSEDPDPGGTLLLVPDAPELTEDVAASDVTPGCDGSSG